MQILACDPGARPGLRSAELVHFDPAQFDGVEWAEFVVEDQHAAPHIYRGGKKVAVSRKSQMGLVRNTEALFWRFKAERKYRYPIADWRRQLWKTATRLTKPVVLARLRADFGHLVEWAPAKHQPDMLEACGIYQAWSTLTQVQKRKYLQCP